MEDIPGKDVYRGRELFSKKKIEKKRNCGFLSWRLRFQVSMKRVFDSIQHFGTRQGQRLQVLRHVLLGESRKQYWGGSWGVVEMLTMGSSYQLSNKYRPLSIANPISPSTRISIHRRGCQRCIERWWLEP